jgi:uncharacterized membrane protein YphA (DoxX/SURF4 family)
VLEAEHERIPNRIDTLATWLPRLALAVAFLMIGASKFRDPMWVRLFEKIGFGQWFRYLAGAMPVGGAILALVPRLALLGIALIVCTLVGAVVVWIVFGQPFAAIIPGTLLAVVLAIGYAEYRRPL